MNQKRTSVLALAFLTVITLSVGLAPSQAKALTDLSLVGVGTMTSASRSGTLPDGFAVSYGSELGLGGGALLGLHFPGHLGLEIGGLYAQRKFKQTAETPFGKNVDTFTTKFIEVPVLLRYHFTRFVSLGLGGYYAVASGKIKVKSETTPPGEATQTEEGESDYSAVGLKKKDYGVVGSISLALPMGLRTSFLIDARYMLGLANMYSDSTDGASLKLRDIQGLVGLRFSL